MRSAPGAIGRGLAISFFKAAFGTVSAFSQRATPNSSARLRPPGPRTIGRSMELSFGSTATGAIQSPFRWNRRHRKNRREFRLLAPKATSRRRATRRFTGLTNKTWSSTATLVYPALMPAFICTACGTQYPPSEALPGACPICIDERQFVPASGQSWTTLDGLRNAHSNKVRRLAERLTTIESTPAFGIRQRAILASSPAGNVLWDCLALIDDGTVDLLKGLGGVAAIAISHPHYYTTMVEWSRALGGVPIHLHAADRQWVMRDPAVQFWEGD